MGADLRALVGIEEALEQRAEDRRVDQAPVEARGGEQEADLGVFEPERRAAVEQAAVELGDVLEIEVAAVLHVGEQLLEPFLGSSPACADAVSSSLRQTPCGSRPTLSAKKQNTSWLTKCATASRSGLRCCKRVGDRLELVGGFLGQLGARAARAQLLRIEEDRVEDREILPARRGRRARIRIWRELRWSSASRRGRDGCRRRRAAAGSPAPRRSG